MSRNITHDGIVIKAEGSLVTVRFVQSSACSGCHAKGICSSQDSVEKCVVADAGNERYQVGDSVNIHVDNGTAWKAVCYAFALPLILALACLFVFVPLWGEVKASMATLAVLGLYFIGLFLCRKVLESKVEFTVTRKV